MNWNVVTAGALILASVAWCPQCSASTLTVGAGWDADVVDTSGGFSETSPMTFTLSRQGVFSLTDAFSIGDVYTISGSVTGSSTFAAPTFAIPLGLGMTLFDDAFYNDAYSHFQALLPAGTYTVSIVGDGAGGLPSMFGIRADLSPVPLPASAPMFGGALVLVVALRHAFGRRPARGERHHLNGSAA